MIKRSLALLAIFGIAVGVQEIRYLELNGAHLIDTSPSNYGITSPTLVQNNWKTVSVNGDNLVVTTQTCETIVKNVNALSETEKTLIGNARNELINVDGGNSNGMTIINGVNGQARQCSVRYSFDGSQSRVNNAINMNTSTFSSNSNGASMSTYGDGSHFSVAKPGMPNNMARVFANGDVVTYVYLNGQVRMLPTNCLQPAEQQYLQQLKQEVHQAQEQFMQNMQNFAQNMQNMGQSMQQNMLNMQQNMQQNMQNMFGNGFPFNHAGGNYMQKQQQQYQRPMMQQPYYQQQGLQSQQMYNPTNGGVMQGQGYQMSPGYNQFAQNSFPFNNNPHPFGNNFPFGPYNSPFVRGFPFSG